MLSGENLSLASVSFVLGVGLAGLITRRLVGPIRKLTGSAERVAGGNLDVEVAVSSTDEVGKLAAAFNEMVKGLKDREKVKATFSKYIDARVVRHLLEPGNADLAGERRVMTVLFADIADFSTISERLTPQALVKSCTAHRGVPAPSWSAPPPSSSFRRTAGSRRSTNSRGRSREHCAADGNAGLECL